MSSAIIASHASIMPRTFPLFAPHDPDRVSKPGAPMDFNPLDLILHLDVYLDLLVNNYGPWIYAILFLVIFCETGLVVMPFLPGDSLLFIAGAVAAGGGMDPVLLGGLLMLAAITRRQHQLRDRTNSRRKAVQ